MSTTKKTVLVIGGTGAQGVPVVKALTADSKYDVRVITSNASSSTAIELSKLPGVSLFEGDAYDEVSLRKAFQTIDLVFANTNGFAISEKGEIYWGIRLYELAREFKVEHFTYAGLFYASKLGGYDPKYRTGHLDGKGKVADFISAQPKTPMKWSVLTSCLYAEGLSELLAPRPDPKDPSTLVFSLPIGNGRMPLVYLEDYGSYARWMFDNADQSNGMNLAVAIENISWKDLASVFTEVTGIKAVHNDCTIDEYFKLGIFPDPDAKLGHAVDPNDATVFTVRENFTGFWNTWKDEITNSQEDYELLDEILPTRVRTVKEWMIKTGYRGQPKSVLKDYRDGKASQKSREF